MRSSSFTDLVVRAEQWSERELEFDKKVYTEDLLLNQTIFVPVWTGCPCVTDTYGVKFVLNVSSYVVR